MRTPRAVCTAHMRPACTPHTRALPALILMRPADILLERPGVLIALLRTTQRLLAAKEWASRTLLAGVALFCWLLTSARDPALRALLWQCGAADLALGVLHSLAARDDRDDVQLALPAFFGRPVDVGSGDGDGDDNGDGADGAVRAGATLGFTAGECPCMTVPVGGPVQGSRTGGRGVSGQRRVWGGATSTPTSPFCPAERGMPSCSHRLLCMWTCGMCRHGSCRHSRWLP
jgi:hypothetical protein